MFSVNVQQYMQYTAGQVTQAAGRSARRRAIVSRRASAPLELIKSNSSV